MKSRVRPLILHRDGTTDHIAALGKTHGAFDEKFLQDLLARHPELLPASLLRPDVGELLCIGREVHMHGSGIIDNLYLSTGGYPVVVETKLWRNPQARREVVAQVLDYVKGLVARDYNWFEDVWKEFSAQRGETPSELIEALSEIADDVVDERNYVDRLHRAIDRGDVIALIVGDGIETRLQELVAHLCRDSAHLRYSLGLVSLHCYEMNEDQRLLVVPQLLQEVEPVERAHVRIDVADDLKGKLTVTSVVEPDQSTPAGRKRRTLSEDDLFGGLAEYIDEEGVQKVRRFLDQVIEDGLETEFKASAVMLKLPDPEGETVGASLLAIERGGRIYNPRHGQRQMIKRWGWDKAVVEKIFGGYCRKLHELDQRFSQEGISHLRRELFLPLEEVLDKLDAIEAAILETITAVQEVAGR